MQVELSSLCIVCFIPLCFVGGTAPVCPAPAGSYCPSGTLTVTPCPVGHYCPGGSSGSRSCTVAAGTYCPAGSASNIGTSCPTGSYCTGGTASPRSCTAAAGKYCPAGSSSASGVSCPTGYTCAGGTAQPVVVQALLVQSPRDSVGGHGQDASSKTLNLALYISIGGIVLVAVVVIAVLVIRARRAAAVSRDRSGVSRSPAVNDLPLPVSLFPSSSKNIQSRRNSRSGIRLNGDQGIHDQLPPLNVSGVPLAAHMEAFPSPAESPAATPTTSWQPLRRTRDLHSSDSTGPAYRTTDIDSKLSPYGSPVYRILET
jgi:hypothetical protein